MDRQSDLVLGGSSRRGVPQEEDNSESTRNRAATLEEALTLTGWGKFNCITIAAGGLAVFSSILGLVDISYVLPECNDEFQMHKTHFSLLSISFFMGNVFSCHVWGFLTDVKGRRYVLLTSLFVNFLLYTAATVTPGYTPFLLFRFFSGVVACGASIAGFPYLAEMQPIKQRTTAVLAGNLLVPICFIYAVVLAMAIIPLSTVPVLGASWRMYYFFCGLPSFLTGAIVFYLPESPKFLAVAGRQDLVIETLRTIHRCNYGKREVYSISEITVLDYQTSGRNQPQLSINILYMAKQMWYQTMELFKKPHVWNICRGIIFCFTIFLSLGFVFIWLPNISKLMTTYNSNDNLTVCSVLNYFDQSAPIDHDVIYSAYLGVLFACILQLVFFCIIILLNWIGLNIKIMVSLYLLICFVSSLLVVWITDAFFAILLVGNFLIFGGSSFNALVTVFIQAFPTHIRGMAMCLMLVSVRLGSVFGNSLLSLLMIVNCQLVFFLFSSTFVVCVLVFISFSVGSEEDGTKESGMNLDSSNDERTE